MGETVNLLIVEDNESDAALVVRQLERAGYTVATARRVDRAAELGAALEACAWSAVLCDYALPGFSPEEALAQVQASGLDLSQRLGAGNVVGHALVARAADGYRAVFGLAEVDPHFGHAPLLVNWKNADGTPLPARVGPLQLIATGESRPGRWVRQLQTLEVKSLP